MLEVIGKAGSKKNEFGEKKESANIFILLMEERSKNNLSTFIRLYDRKINSIGVFMKKIILWLLFVLSIILIFGCSSTYRIFNSSFDEIDNAGKVDYIEINVSKTGMSNDIMWIQQYNYTRPSNEIMYIITLNHTVSNQLDNSMLPYLQIQLDDEVMKLDGNVKEKTGINEIFYKKNLYNRGRMYIIVNEEFIRKMANAKKIRLNYFGQTLDFPKYGYDFLKKYVSDVIEGQSNSRFKTPLIP